SSPRVNPSLTANILMRSIHGRSSALSSVHSRSPSTNVLSSTAPSFQSALSLHQGRSQANPYRTKIVFNLSCIYCLQKVCFRGMKAILLSDLKVELYSTDFPPSSKYSI